MKDSFSGDLSLIGAEQQEELADILDRYVLAMERGEEPSLEELAAEHPELAEVLPQYLDGVRMIHEAMALPDSSTEESALPPTTESTGKQIGDYEIIRELGRGGMGVVYEARELSLNRHVALKVLPFAAVLDERQISRFRIEAQAAAGLHHSNIVPVFAVGQERGVHFYAMQYIEGQSVQQALNELREKEKSQPAAHDATTAPMRVEGRLSTVGSIRETHHFRSVARLGIEAAEAIEYAHQYGVVHRDIKPGNLLLDQTGKLWVTDFGLARVQSEMSVTLPGDIIGTLRYMSPEQARGRSDLIDGRTDVYALGCTLYEMLTLQPAHPGDDHHTLVQRIESADPMAPRRLNPSIPIDLETVVLRAMEKSRDDRYTTAQELADDLQRFLEGRSIIARQPNLVERTTKWLMRRRGVAAAVAASLVLVSIISVTSAVWIAAASHRTTEALAQSEAHYRQARAVVDHFGVNLADRLVELPGSERLRRDLLSDTLGYYQEFLKTANADTSLHSDLAVTHFKAAVIAERLGDLTAARLSTQKAVTAWQALASSDVKKSQLAFGRSNLARLESLLGNSAEAEKQFAEAVALQRALFEQFPQEAKRAHELAGTLANRGLMQQRGGDRESATQSLSEAIDFLAVALELEPTNVEFLRSLAVANNNLSETLRSNSPDEAAQACGQAKEALQRLVVLYPAKESYRADLAMACNNLAALEGSQGHWQQASAGYEQAAAEIGRLVRRHPLLPRYRRELAITQSNRGLALAWLDEHEASDAAFAIAAQTLKGLIADFPGQAIYQRSLAALENNRGVALRATGRGDEALVAFADAVDQHEKIAGTANLVMLDKQYRNYADALREADQDEAAQVLDAKRRELHSPSPTEAISTTKIISTTKDAK